jgi:RNA polymerase sigma-70 factor (ECF subfamily)
VQAIAVRTGSPIGTVKARLSRGRDALARLLSDDSLKDPAGIAKDAGTAKDDSSTKDDGSARRPADSVKEGDRSA